jgi:hypothetical protein
MSNPNVSAAVAEAKTAFEWIKAQFATLWSAHKIATIVVFVGGFVTGCTLT